MNIAWWVQRWSELQPSRPAIFFEDQTITYLELHHRAKETSCWLQSLGIEKGDRVAVILENCPEFIEIYLACSRLGALFVPINFRLEAPEIEYTLRNARPRLLLLGESYLETAAKLGPNHRRPFMELAVVSSNTCHPETMRYRPEEFSGRKPFLTKSLGPSDPEEPHVIMYTSGTTGQPKGAVLSHRKTFFNCLNADMFFKLNFDDIMLIVLPLFHSGGLFIQASPILYKGGTMVVHPRFDPARVYADIEKYRVTKFLGVPTIWRSLIKEAPQHKKDISSLEVCAIGGEKTTHKLLIECMEMGFPLRQIMGQTETSILLWASEEDSIRRPGTVGRPVFHAEVALLGKDGRQVAPGEVGEIVVRGSIMMKEYWQDPDRTGETIRNGWLHTGDLAQMDGEGYFYLVDRAKDMYISGGENVYPAEVEKVLREHPMVEEAAVIGVPDEVWGEVGHAFIIAKEEARLTPDEIIAFCNGRIARFKWPKSVTFCRELPRTTLGKVRKSLLKEGR